MLFALLEGDRNASPGALNTAGGFFLRQNDAVRAEAAYRRASEAAPDLLEYAVNRAIALSRLERHSDVEAILAPFEDKAAGDVRYWSARGNAARSRGLLDDAARFYDRALALQPVHPRASLGRARVALERAEDDAVARFDAALAGDQGNAELWLGKAYALDAAGESEAARKLAEALVQQAPNWTQGLKLLAELRLAAGEDDFASHYEEAARRVPADPNIPAQHIEVLAGLDRAGEAADIAGRARGQFPQEDHFILTEAINASAAGREAWAQELWDALDKRAPERKLHHARHLLRKGDYHYAESELAAVIEADPHSIGAWALRDLAWRALGDVRHDWLHAQDGLVALMPLEADDGVFERARELLERLHDRSAMPLGQSLRGGTQTRGLLFARLEPELRALRGAIMRTVERYRQQLPPRDAIHPLLGQRDAQWAMEGSWSVRLEGGGDFHTGHIHPQGLLSSALYMALPDVGGAAGGRLELGRPPRDLGMDMEPMRIVEPVEGHMALFPSTLYHGTEPFGAGRRMSVAFDIVARHDVPAHG